MKRLLSALLVVSVLCVGCSSGKYAYSTSNASVTPDELYDKLYKENGIDSVAKLLNVTVPSLAYETTNELREAAKTDSLQTITFYQQNYGNTYNDVIDASMRNSGFESHKDIEDYFLNVYKSNMLVRDYIESTLEENKIRQISYILVKFDDGISHDATPTETEKKKMDSVDASLARGKEFSEVAKEFTEDESTKEDGGLLGVIDKYTDSLVSSFLEASLELPEHEVSDWVYSPEYGYFKIRNDASTKNGFHTLYPDQFADDKPITSASGLWYSSLINSFDMSLYSRALYMKAKELNIGFADPTVERELLEYFELDDLLPKETSSTDSCSVDGKESCD